MEEPSYAELQRVVQRKLGRCMIQIQQYELLLKEMVAKSEIAGELRAMDAQIANNVAAVATKTMGSLVGELTEKYFMPTLRDPSQAQSEGDPADGSFADAAADVDDEHPAGWARVRMQVSLPPGAHAQMKAELQDLVDLRNDLVHHFVEGQDLVSEVGCIAAEMYLDDCYAEIDRHLTSLRGWATSMNEARLTMASFMTSQAFEDVMAPAESSTLKVPELISTTAQSGVALQVLIDLLLRAEAAQTKTDGWASLNRAIAFIKEVAPDETPAKHAFGSWRHVLHLLADSLEVRRRAAAPGGPVEAWYRSRK